MEAHRHLADQAVVGALLREIDLARRMSSRIVLLVNLAEEDDDRDLNVVELVAAHKIRPERVSTPARSKKVTEMPTHTNP